MNFDRKEIKANAREAFKASYWPIVGYTLLAGIIMGAVGACSAIPYVGVLIAVLGAAPLTVGVYYLNYTYYRGDKPEITPLFEGFKGGKFLHVVGGYYYMMLFEFLWSLLFIIPGIIKGIAYSMTPYILIDQPEISATDALKKSMEMTKGHKWEIFVMALSFLGWDILCACTLGILEIFYVGPYQAMSMAGIYDYLKRENAGFVEVEDMQAASNAQPVEEETKAADADETFLNE